MKYLIFILIGFFFLQLTNCKKKDLEPTPIVYSDGKLTDGIWKVEKMTTSSGVIIPNPDKGTNFENAQIFVEFNANNSIQFSFSGMPGSGTYSLDSGNTIAIDKYAINVEIGFESKYYDLHLESMKSVTHYSIDGNNLKLYYGLQNSIIYLNKF